MPAKIIKYIASAKMPECEGSISQFSFKGQPPNYLSHAFNLACPVDEFSFKEMKTWGPSKFTSYCICIWYESEELGARKNLRFPCAIPVVETS